MSKNTTIRHKRSSVSGNVPDNNQIDVGEIALNLADKIIFTKDGTDQVVELSNPADYLQTTAYGFDNTVDSASINKLTVGPDNSGDAKLHFDLNGSPHTLQAKEGAIDPDAWIDDRIEDAYWADIAYGNGLWVAVTDNARPGKIAYSYDGETFTDATLPTEIQGNTWGSVIWVEELSRFIAGGYFGEPGSGSRWRFAYSSDGISWNRTTTDFADKSAVMSGLAYGNNTIVAVTRNGTYSLGNGKRMWRSTDGGVTWTQATDGPSNDWTDVAFGNGTFVSVAPSGTQTSTKIMYSTDNGVTWTAADQPADTGHSWNSVAYGTGSDGVGRFVAVAGGFTTGDTEGNDVMYSEDGITWYAARSGIADRDRNNTPKWKKVIYTDGVFLAIGTKFGHRYLYSLDGVNWVASEEYISGTYHNFRSLAYGNNEFIALGWQGSAARLAFNPERTGLYYDGELIATEFNLQPLFDVVNELSQEMVDSSQVNPWVETPTGIEYTAGFAEVSESPTKAHHIVNKAHLDGTQIVPPNGDGISSIDWNGNSTTLTSDWPLLISVDGTTFGNTVEIKQGQTLYMMWAGSPGSGEGIDSPHGTVLEGEINSSDGKVWYYEFTVQKEVTFVVHSSVDSNQELGGYSVSETYEVTGVNSYVYPTGSTTGDSAQYELITDAGTRANGYLDLPDSEGSSPQFNYMVAGDKFRLRHRNPNSTDTASNYNFVMAGDSANWTTVTAGTVSVPVTPSFDAPNPVAPILDMEGMIRSTPFKMSDGSTSGHVSTDWEITKVNTAVSTDDVLARQDYVFYHPNFGYHAFGSLFNTDGDPAHRRSTDGQTWASASGNGPFMHTRSHAVAAVNDTTMVIVGGTFVGSNFSRIYYSTDGVAFTEVPDTDKGVSGTIYDNRPWHQSVIWNGTNFFIFCNQRGRANNADVAYILLYSSDGITWTDGTAGVVAGSIEPESIIMNTQTSTDKYENQVGAGVGIGPIWTGTKIVAIFNGYEVMSSPDGFTWTSEHVFDHIIDTLGGDRTSNPEKAKLGGFKYYDAETGYLYVDKRPGNSTLRAHIDDLATWTEIECTVGATKSMLPESIVYDSEQELYMGLQNGSFYYCESSDLLEWFGGNGHRPVGNQLTAENKHIGVTKTPLGYLCAINNAIQDNGFNRSKHYVPVGYVTFDSEDRIADTTNLTTYEPPFDANEYRFMKVRYNTATESSLWSNTVGFTTSGAQGWFSETFEGYLYEPGFTGVPQGSYAPNSQELLEAYPDLAIASDLSDAYFSNSVYAAQSTTAIHYGNATGAYGFSIRRSPDDLSDLELHSINLYLQDRGEGNDEPASQWWYVTPWNAELFGQGAVFDGNLEMRECIFEFVHGSNTGEYAILSVFDTTSSQSGGTDYGWGVVAFESPHNGDLRMYPTTHLKDTDFSTVVADWDVTDYSNRPRPRKLIRDFSTEYNPLTIVVGEHSALAHITLDTKNDGTTSPSITLRSELHDIFGQRMSIVDGVHDGNQFVVIGYKISPESIALATSPDGITWTDRTAALTSAFSTTTWPDGQFADLAEVESVEYEDFEQVYGMLRYSSRRTSNILYNGSELRIIGNLGVSFTSTDGGVTWTRDNSLYDHLQLYTKRDRPARVNSWVWHQTYDTSGNVRNGYYVATLDDIRVPTLSLGLRRLFFASLTPGEGWKSPAANASYGGSGRNDPYLNWPISNNTNLIGAYHHGGDPWGWAYSPKISRNLPILPEE